jgi:hypothetical protein
MSCIKKSFCGVCKNAGKSESEYTNHYTKSSPGPRGVVVCPTILQATCAYCRRVGHFKNKCPVLLEKGRSQKKATVSPAVSQTAMPPIRSNLFDALSFEDEDEDEHEEPVVSTVAPISNKMSYASILLSGSPVAPSSVKVLSNNWADCDSSDEED